MQSKTFKKLGIEYKFHYIEQYNIIFVFKNNKHSYNITVKKKKGGVILNCSCPGNKYHGYCFHKKEALSFNFNKISKPGRFIDRINEEFMNLWLERRRIGG